MTAAEVAEHFELHPNVARHHLEKLAGGGYLDRRARPARAGGPSVEALPRQRARHDARRSRRAATTCSPRCSPRALELLDPDEAAAIAEEVGLRVRARARGQHGAAGPPTATGHRSVQAAVATVADALTAHGFAAHTEDARRHRSRSSPSTARSARPRRSTRTWCARSTAA